MKSLVVLTGASRGFGREILNSILSSFIFKDNHVDVILISRKTPLLEDARAATVAVVDGTVRAIPIDFANLDGLEEAFDNLYAGISPTSYECVYLFNNAGSLGKLDKLQNLGVQDIRKAIDVNVTAPFALTSHFLKTFSTCPQKRVINISSLAAVQAFDCWSIYCTGKAARDMFHVAAKEEGVSGLKTLNYAPGPLDTDMQAEIRKDMPDVPLRHQFKEMFEGGKLVKPRDSADRLTRLLEKDAYESGAHIDFFDPE